MLADDLASRKLLSDEDFEKHGSVFISFVDERILAQIAARINLEVLDQLLDLIQALSRSKIRDRVMLDASFFLHVDQDPGHVHRKMSLLVIFFEQTLAQEVTILLDLLELLFQVDESLDVFSQSLHYVAFHRPAEFRFESWRNILIRYQTAHLLEVLVALQKDREEHVLDVLASHSIFSVEELDDVLM